MYTFELYQPFDFPRRSTSEHVRWFEWRARDQTRRLYAIEDEQGRVIGSLTLRDMQGRSSARLGITVGADFVSQGYGTEALRLFLVYYFEEMGFDTMVLDVASTNLRAVRAYESLGFRHSGQHYRPAAHSSFRIVRTDARYRHLRRLFRRRGTMYEVLYYDMALTRDEWLASTARTE